MDPKSSPVDIASRGATTKELMKSDWFSGPDFLWQPDLAVKGCDPQTYPVQSDDPEVKAVQCLVSVTMSHNQKPMLARFERLSSWTKVKKAVPIVLRFKNMLKQHLIKKSDTQQLQCKGKLNYRPLSVKELQAAENVVLQQVQHSSFRKELE